MKYRIDYFGFVYIWHDRKRQKFVIGSHMGDKDDGYVTSTGHAKRAFSKRPEDFRRRILEWVSEDNKKLLWSLEQKWLNLIKDEELGIRYYNLKKVARGGSIRKGHKNNPIHCQRISESHIGLTHSEETKRKISQNLCGERNPMFGKKRPDITSFNLSREYKTGWKHTEDSLNKMRKPKPKGFGEQISKALKGKPKSEEHKQKLSLAKKGKSNPKVAIANKGKIPWNKGLKKCC